MQEQTKQCQNCKNKFTIEPEDFSFYEKISSASGGKVPPPTFCPECRMIRRFSAINIWSLYKRSCGRCGDSIISIYAPENPRIVYCLTCWWADDWDGTEYGREYNPSRPFFEQLRELSEITPYQALESAHLTMTNSDYCNAAGHLKNCYLCYWADYCENTYYSSFLNGLKDSLDCYRVKKSELLYECIGMNASYNCIFSEECDSCNNVHFSRSCFGCTNCIGCINLRGSSYCIFNKKYSKEEYKTEVAKMKLETMTGIRATRERAEAFWLKHPRREYIGNSLNFNVTGEYVYESKNSKDMYMCSGAEDCRWCQIISMAPARDCYDYSGWGNGAERIYESVVVGEGARDVKFSLECWPNVLETEYSMYAIAGKYNFGCVNLKHKQYAILNKVYTEDEYKKLRTRIIADMERNPYVDAQGRVWKYGEFFPISMNLFAYNESVAHLFFPKEKKQAIAEGYQWYEGTRSEYTITKQACELPETISEVADIIIKEVIECANCRRAYRIIESELMLYRKMNLPPPRICPACRHTRRFNRCAKPIFYDRICAKCSKSIKTSYAPDRPEIVYCEKCYQQEVY
ncbi:MAG: hypothetical protein UV08_C0007G0028 [Parcubacteria group bacterium GW2011_GWA2_42_18]|nr:MAG: hypothetical protein UV08_C0007G0028 [Parcubacteria group bacterium GW2011_GWA2_42_18]